MSSRRRQSPGDGSPKPPTPKRLKPMTSTPQPGLQIEGPSSSSQQLGIPGSSPHTDVSPISFRGLDTSSIHSTGHSTSHMMSPFSTQELIPIDDSNIIQGADPTLGQSSHYSPQGQFALGQPLGEQEGIVSEIVLDINVTLGEGSHYSPQGQFSLGPLLEEQEGIGSEVVLGEGSLYSPQDQIALEPLLGEEEVSDSISEGALDDIPEEGEMYTGSEWTATDDESEGANLDEVSVPSVSSEEDIFPTEIRDHYLTNQNQLDGLTEVDLRFVYLDASQPYVFIKVIGKGTYASVYKAVTAESMNTPNKKEVAIKVAKPKDQHRNAAVVRELAVLNRLIESPHTNVVLVHEMFENDPLATFGTYYSVFELAPLGDLSHVLRQLNDQGHKIWVPLQPQYCRHLIWGIAQGVKHLFSLGISHADIKPENILIFWDESQSNQTQDYSMNRFIQMVPKLIDFNNSGYGEPGEPIMLQKPRCSIYTAAPESWITNTPYDSKIADMFSLGAVLLSMLMGCDPFKPPPNCPKNQIQFECTQMKKDRNVLRQLVRPFDSRLKQVLLRLLEPLPQNRISIQEFLSDDWFTQRMESQELEERWGTRFMKGQPQHKVERSKSVDLLYY